MPLLTELGNIAGGGVSINMALLTELALHGWSSLYSDGVRAAPLALCRWFCRSPRRGCQGGSGNYASAQNVRGCFAATAQSLRVGGG